MFDDNQENNFQIIICERQKKLTLCQYCDPMFNKDLEEKKVFYWMIAKTQSRFSDKCTV